MRKIVIAAASRCVTSLAALSSADTLIMRDGTGVVGKKRTAETVDAGAQVLTRGPDVQVPANMVLKFRLDKRVTLQPEQ